MRDKAKEVQVCLCRRGCAPNNFESASRFAKVLDYCTTSTASFAAASPNFTYLVPCPTRFRGAASQYDILTATRTAHQLRRFSSRRPGPDQAGKGRKAKAQGPVLRHCSRQHFPLWQLIFHLAAGGQYDTLHQPR